MNRLFAKYAQYVVKVLATGPLKCIKIYKIKCDNTCITQVCFMKIY
jgi:hypothetical protein